MNRHNTHLRRASQEDRRTNARSFERNAWILLAPPEVFGRTTELNQPAVAAGQAHLPLDVR